MAARALSCPFRASNARAAVHIVGQKTGARGTYRRQETGKSKPDLPLLFWRFGVLAVQTLGACRAAPRVCDPGWVGQRGSSAALLRESAGLGRRRLGRGALRSVTIKNPLGSLAKGLARPHTRGADGRGRADFLDSCLSADALQVVRQGVPFRTFVLALRRGMFAFARRRAWQLARCSACFPLSSVPPGWL
jgi:hypothetical protein